MARLALLGLPPTRADLRAAEWMAEEASPPLEDAATLVTWAADGQVMLAVAGLAWLGVRLLDGDARHHRAADHLLLSVAAAGAVPHAFKWIVRRQRPDRRVTGWRHRGVPRSGKPYDSFPSGHAVHLGAAAAALSRVLPTRWRLPIWASAVGIAGTRMVLLAHWLTDVVAGFAIGCGLEVALAQLQPSGTISNPRPPPSSSATRA